MNISRNPIKLAVFLELIKLLIMHIKDFIAIRMASRHYLDSQFSSLEVKEAMLEVEVVKV